MALRFFIKRKTTRPLAKPQILVKPKIEKKVEEPIVLEVIDKEVDVTIEEKELTKVNRRKNKKNKVKNSEAMNINEKIKFAEETLATMEPEVKVVKSDKGLIERTESSKIILTEDNRQLLVD